jgi:hypothetical protein
VGATRANDFPRQANQSGQSVGDHASSRTDPNDVERQTGIYELDGQAGTTASRKAPLQATGQVFVAGGLALVKTGP